MIRHLPTILLAFCLALCLHPVAAAAVVDGIRPAVAKVTVLRGGVLLVPLSAATPGRDWPSTVELRFEDGEIVPAEVCWIHRAAPRPARRWTDDPSGLAIRPIQPDDDSAAPVDQGAPYAIAALAMGRGGDFTIADPRAGRPASAVIVRPDWIDPSSLAAPTSTIEVAIASGNAGTTAAPPPPLLERRLDDGLPDPESPFEYFRWVLLAKRAGERPPTPPGSGVAALLAQHGAEMWSIGLARLGAQSPGVASACIDALTSTVLDGERRVAAWVTDPVETDALLSLLLDRNKRDRSIMDSALAWAESRDPLVMWPEREQGSIVTLSVLNPLARDVTLEAAWAGSDSEPTRRTLRGGELTRVNIARPGALPGALIARVDPRRTPLSLLLEAEGRRRTMGIAPAVADAKPPGVPLALFRPPLRLAEARVGAQLAVTPERSTVGLVRRVQGRWELFVECGRPERADAATGADAPVNPDVATPVDPFMIRGLPALPRGREALVLTIGPRERPDVVLAIPEEGEPWRMDSREAVDESEPQAQGRPGSDALGPPIPGSLPADLGVHRRSLPTLWRCRVVLPESWLPPMPREGDERQPLLLGAIRLHGTDDAIEIAGLPQPPWDPWPAPMAVDLSAWEG